MPAGEIDRGTADFLLCLPVSRWKVFVAESIGWLISGACILSLGYVGHLTASLAVQPEMRLSVANTMMVMANFGAVYLAVGSFAFLISAFSDRRGRAIGVVFTVLLASFLLNFLANAVQSTAFIDDNAAQSPTSLILQSAKIMSPWLSVMEYYRPAIIIQTGLFPWGDVKMLLALAAILWVAGGVTFRMRSVCTV